MKILVPSTRRFFAVSKESIGQFMRMVEDQFELSQHRQEDDQERIERIKGLLDSVVLVVDEGGEAKTQPTGN